MPSATFLKSSLALLTEITNKTHNDQIRPIANSIWQKQLNNKNPLWKNVTAKAFALNNSRHSAHVIAILDKRLPGIGLVGFFGCTDKLSGVKILNEACDWLKTEYDIKNIYGPINGTITRDYRFNLNDDYKIPGEPVNPTWYIDVFKEAGFIIYNRYVSGIAKRYQLFIKFYTAKKPAKKYSHAKVRPFDVNNQANDLKIYHELMNEIFPRNSIYCPVITWDERLYNISGKEPVFDPLYTYFLEDNGKAVGFIVAHTYKNQLVLKTIGLLPLYRGKYLAGLLVKRVHDQAKDDGLNAAVYSTIRVGNAVYKMRRPGVKVFRKYITMQKKL
jgi:hypothetical protein